MRWLRRIPRRVSQHMSRRVLTRVTVALVVLNLAVLGVLFVAMAHARHGFGSFGISLIDLDVYRLGSRMWLDGGNLYGPLPPLLGGGALPFTYPPFAAIVLSPLAMVHFWLAGVILTVVSLGLVVLVVALVLRADRIRPAGAWLTVALLVAAPAAMLFEPVRANIDNGQINIVLMAMVAVDCLVARDGRYGRRYRGVLIGLAAAIKLTPAVFVLFLLLDRDRSPAARSTVRSTLGSTLGGALRAAGAFLAATGLAFLLATRDSIAYWTTVLGQTDRIGNPVYTSNQSITGVLARFGLPEQWRTGLWLVLAVLVLGITAVAIRRCLGTGRTSLALGITALAELLISPVSWSHHWVWVVPLLLSLAIVAVRERATWAAVLTAVGAVVFALSPEWWVPHGGEHELSWSWWHHLLGDAYVWFGLAALVTVAVVAIRPARHARFAEPARFAEIIG